MVTKRRRPKRKPPLKLDEAERLMLQRNVSQAEKIERLAQVYLGRDREVLRAWEAQLAARVQERLGVDLEGYNVGPDGTLTPREEEE